MSRTLWSQRTGRRVGFALLVAICTFALVACGPSPLVRAGDATAVGSIALQTPVDWSRFGDSRVELWTRDGTLLNQLQFVGAVEPGQHVFRSRRETKRRPDGPYFRSGMNGLELQALVLDGLAELGAVRPTARALRPKAFGDSNGSGESVRFDVATANQDGLTYSGIAQASVHQGKLYVMLFLAPSEHYFERDRALVEQILDSARPID
ncbi:MAG: hypothetical protein ABIP49_10935 [Lysobacterales bacterium]